jgi:hypothetical protein
LVFFALNCFCCLFINYFEIINFIEFLMEFQMIDFKLATFSMLVKYPSLYFVEWFFIKDLVELWIANHSNFKDFDEKMSIFSWKYFIANVLRYKYYLGKSLLTTFVFTLIRFFLVVDSLMLLHRRVLSKSALTYWTIKIEFWMIFESSIKKSHVIREWE